MSSEIIASMNMGGKLCKILNLPKNTRWFEIRFAIDEVATVKGEYILELDKSQIKKFLFQLEQCTFKEKESKDQNDVR